jgi:hypothetical protein
VGRVSQQDAGNPLCSLTRRLRRAEAEFVALHDRVLENIGLDRSEIGSVMMDDTQERTDGVQQKHGHDVSGD